MNMIIVNLTEKSRTFKEILIQFHSLDTIISQGLANFLRLTLFRLRHGGLVTLGYFILSLKSRAFRENVSWKERDKKRLIRLFPTCWNHMSMLSHV